MKPIEKFDVSRLREFTQRLQQGICGSGSLEKLVVGLRGRTFGRKSIQELGDLVSHPFDKTTGHSVEFAKHHALSSAGIRELNASTVRPPYPLPEYFAPMCRSRLWLASNEALTSKHGYSKNKAEKLVNNKCRRLKKANASDFHRLVAEADTDALFHDIAFTFGPKTIFSPASLHNDLAYVLLRNELLSKSEVAALPFSGDKLSMLFIFHAHCQSFSYSSSKLYGLAVTIQYMIGTDVPENPKDPESHKSKLELVIRASFPEDGKPIKVIDTACLKTNLHAADWVDLESFGTPPDPCSIFEDTLELDDKFRLRNVGRARPFRNWTE
jgi:hypothetical protein